MTNPILSTPKKKSWLFTPVVPYVPQPKGTPWYAINWGATFVFFGISIMLCIIFLIGLINNVPKKSELQILFGKIIKIKDSSPQILIELPSGKLKSMEFPNFILIGKQNYLIDEKESNLLIGCNVEIRGVPMRFVFGNNRFRIFELICIEKKITIGGLDKEGKRLSLQLNQNINLFLILWILCPVSILIYVIYRERKFYRE